MAVIYLTLLRTGLIDGNETGALSVMIDEAPAASLQRTLPPDTLEARAYRSRVKLFRTIENTTYLRNSSLRVGDYELKHDMLTHDLKGNPLPNPKRCLRPTEERIKHILIHAAKDATDANLSGCIAPGLGLYKPSWTLEESKEAINQLFQAIGTYAQGKLITLRVMSNATGVGPEETRDTWYRTAAQP